MTNPTDPAFPVSSGGALFDGLTKLELFAAMVMHGMVASPDFIWSDIEKNSNWAIKQAKALIAALEKEQVRT